MAIKVSYYINAPVESVFDHFKDPASDEGIGMEVVDAKATEEGVGTFMDWRVKVAGIPVWRGLEVLTDVVPNERIVEKSSSAMLGDFEYTFEPEGSGTRLTIERRARSFWALPPLANLVDFATTRTSRGYMDRVKAKLEPGPTVPRQRKPAASKPRKPAASKPQTPAASR